MRKMAVINQKGGVGKTTTTVNLGAALAAAGRRVLMFDLDPQAHLSLHFGTEVGDDEPSLYEVLTDGVPLDDILRHPGRNVSLAPAHIDLASAEAELVSVPGREVLLREALEQSSAQYDAVLVDCPPSLGTLTINSLVLCDEVLIPLQAHFLALQGLSRLLDTVSVVRQRINPNLRVTAIVLCMHDAATRLATEVVEDLRRFLEGARGTSAPWAEARICETFVRRNIKLAEAASFGESIFTYAPRSNGAVDYADLAFEIFGARAVVEEAERPAGATERGVEVPEAAANQDTPAVAVVEAEEDEPRARESVEVVESVDVVDVPDEVGAVDEVEVAEAPAEVEVVEAVGEPEEVGTVAPDGDADGERVDGDERVVGGAPEPSCTPADACD